MFWMKDMLTREKVGQKAQGMVEYALIIAFVVALGMILLTVRPEMKDALGEVFNGTAEVVSSSS